MCNNDKTPTFPSGLLIFLDGFYMVHLPTDCDQTANVELGKDDIF